MGVPEDEVKELLVEILEDQDAVAATTGVFRNELEHTYDVERGYQDVRRLLEELRDEGVMEYNHGEFGEFAFSEEE